jgi:hypothetical protein
VEPQHPRFPPLSSTEFPESLESAARLVIQNQRQSHQELFHQRLRTEANVGSLHEFASRFSSHPEVSVPAYQRLLELVPGDPDYTVELGIVHYMNGEDELALSCVKTVQESLPNHVPALMLEAALTRDPEAKRKLYTRVVMIEPRNRTAFDNLIMLRRQ